MMTLGVPTFVRQILGSISFAVLNNAAAVYGDSAIAAVSVTMRIFSLFMMGLMGLAHGLQPLAGYNYGAKRFDRVRETIRTAFVTAASVSLAVSVTALASAPGIMQIFTPQDPDVVYMGTQALRLMAVAFVPIALVLMFGGVFQALGHGRAALLLAMGQQGLFLIPLVLILPRIWGVTGVFAAGPAGFVLAFLVGVVLLSRSMRELKGQQVAVGTSSI
jgi:Na+-driven multidrug efflux pump